MKRKLSILSLIILLIAFVGVSATLAYLVASTRTVTNTFTAGNIEIILSESTGMTYKMIPGATVDKDPTVTVKGGSDACWLFFRVEKEGGFDSYMHYEIATGWNSLDGVEGVYYRQVEHDVIDRKYPIIKDNTVTIYDTVTEEQLNKMARHPVLRFTAYAIQLEGNETVQDAWHNLIAKEE